MFWVVLIIFAYSFEKICQYIAEQRKYKNMKTVQVNYKNNYDYDFAKKNPTLEDVMFDTGLSDEELDQILPDFNMDLEDFE